MTDLKPTVLTALNALPACTALAFAREEQSLPIITVADENISIFAQADGTPYLEEHILRIDIYTAAQSEASSLAGQTDAALTALGLRLTASQESFDEAAYAWRRQLRYRALIHQDTIYQ
ncbi:MAG: hypothetical protein IJ189_05945 [Clostridia bacterium]|nr:hypothetical protein [Clostridia bacterium]